MSPRTPRSLRPPRLEVRDPESWLGAHRPPMDRPHRRALLRIASSPSCPWHVDDEAHPSEARAVRRRTVAPGRRSGGGGVGGWSGSLEGVEPGGGGEHRAPFWIVTSQAGGWVTSWWGLESSTR